MMNHCYQILVGLAIVSFLLAIQRDYQALIDLLQFLQGVTTGFMLHYVYLERRAKLPERHWRLTYAIGLVLASSIVMIGELPGLALSRLLFLIGLNYAVITIRYISTRLLLLMLSGAVLIITDSKAMLLAVVCGALLSFVLRRTATASYTIRMAPTFALSILGVSIFLLVLYQWNPSRFNDLVNPQESISTMSRVAMLVAGVKASIDHPFLGLGPSGLNRPDGMEAYYSDIYIDDLINAGLTVSHGQVHESGFSSGVHNMYVDVASAYGFLVFTIVIVCLYRGFRHALQHCQHLKLASLITIAVLGLAWQYSVTSYGITALVFCMWPFRFSLRESRRLVFTPSPAMAAHS